MICPALVTLVNAIVATKVVPARVSDATDFSRTRSPCAILARLVRAAAEDARAVRDDHQHSDALSKGAAEWIQDSARGEDN